MRLTRILLLSGAAISAAGSSVQVRDIDGQLFSPFEPAGRARVLFFVASDCPVSNAYAPEIQRFCTAYGSKGVGCRLLYEDFRIDAGAVRKHLDEYGYRSMPAAIDADRAIADRAKATVTPSAVVIDRTGAIRYRGRIDNLYAALGKPRRQVTSHDLSDALDAVLAGKPVRMPETEAVGCYIAPPGLLGK